MYEIKKVYFSKISFILKKISKELSFRHLFSSIYSILLRNYRYYLQKQMVSKKKFIPSIKQYFSKDLNEINYRTLIPKRKIEFTKEEKEFLNEDIACSKRIKNNRDKGYVQREVFSCRLKNVKFFGHSGVVVYDNKSLLDTACTLTRLYKFTRSVDNVFYKHKKMKGIYTSILGLFPFNFHHFLIENIPRFYGISKIKEETINIIISDEIRKWKIEILKIFYEKSFNFIPIRRNEVWELENYYYSSFFFIDCSIYYPKELLEYMRNKVFTHYGIIPKERNKRVFLSREKTGHRIIKNIVEFKNLLKKYDFEVIHPQDLSFKEQVEIFNSTEIVIGMMGSAFSNILFGNNLKVIIFFPPSAIITHYMLFCKCLNFPYRYIIGHDQNEIHDCNIDLSKAEELIKELIN